MKSFLSRGGPGPYIFSRERPKEFSEVPSELAFLICTIRETFEEPGILLVRDINRLRNEPINEDQPVSGKSSFLSDSILKLGGKGSRKMPNSDDLYPEDPYFDGEREILSVLGTMEQLMIRYPNINRSEMFHADDNSERRNFVCNIKMKDGQLPPLFKTHWREAATLLLVAKSRTPVVSKFQTCNLQILMLKRSGKSKFMPKLHVFPGGVADAADFSPEWLDQFGKLGNDSVNSMKSFLSRGGPGPYMFSRERSKEFSEVPSELAFRICALRVTFKESGILLVRDINGLRNEPIKVGDQPVSGKSSILSDSILKPWRERVDEDASQFITLCKTLDIVPDVWSLFEWSNWLTPKLSVKVRRYDTAFFLCVVDYMPEAIHCYKETTELEWSSASQFVLKHQDQSNSLKLAPPQIVELGRILHRCRKGDDLYPEDPDFDGEREILSVPGTMERLRIKYPNMNRSEMLLHGDDASDDWNFVCNIKMKDGQLPPLFETFDSDVPQANL
ncbi:NUD19-like protein [Mya arenaria]|uniref:NUD19-like protein n=1 Tax=Mya arenaria TaxID=6604 RepID=A0ABY7EY39_MYAAR|nr:NUD19-like protein [Mya arenaria]